MSTGQGILGANMFAYCNNNPTNLSDNSGALPRYAFLGDNHIFSDKILTGGSGGGIPCTSRVASAAVIENEKKFINNTDERVVLESENLAFYKGTLVIKVPGVKGSGFTFGAIFIGEEANANLIRHEYGHIVQLQETDIMTYTAYMVIPSLVCYGLSQSDVLSWSDYFDRPWEYLADQFGGASRNYAPWAAPVAEIYWGIAKTASLFF